jgi:hypothetical protein
MGEKKQGRQAGAQDEVSSHQGILVAARGATSLPELPTRYLKATPAPEAGRSGNRNLKGLLDVLCNQRDAKGNPNKFEKQSDLTLTLGTMLRKLKDRFSRPGDSPSFHLRFEVDNKAFEAEGVNKDPEGLGLGIDKATIPEETNISLATYLQNVLNRVEGGPLSGVVFVVKREPEPPLVLEKFDGTALPPPQYVVLITTTHFARHYRGLPALVDAEFDATPLKEALRKLSEAEGSFFSVVVNASLIEAKAPVTARFRNVPLDTAVWILADMAGLTVLREDNLLYVTSREAARPPTRPVAPMKPPMVEKK